MIFNYFVSLLLCQPSGKPQVAHPTGVTEKTHLEASASVSFFGANNISQFSQRRRVDIFHILKLKQKMPPEATYNDRQYLLSNSVSSLGSTDAEHAKPVFMQQLNTIHWAVLHLMASTAIFIAGVILELKWMADFTCQSYFLLLYIRCGYWLFTYMIDSIISHRHLEIRRYGYHDFYHSKILRYKNAPLHIVSLWNTTILLVQTVMQQNYGAEFVLHCQRMVASPITYICLFCGVETILLIFIHGSYIMRVWKFNRSTHLPDALRDTDHPFIGSLGVTVDNAKVAELLEKQADMIHYLREMNFNLNKKLMQLNDKVKAATTTNGRYT